MWYSSEIWLFLCRKACALMFVILKKHAVMLISETSEEKKDPLREEG
jgi:hypothetical protein